VTRVVALAATPRTFRTIGSGRARGRARAGRDADHGPRGAGGAHYSSCELRTRRCGGVPRVSTGHRDVCPFPTWQAAAVVRSGASSTERPSMLFRLRALVVPRCCLPPRVAAIHHRHRRMTPAPRVPRMGPRPLRRSTRRPPASACRSSRATPRGAPRLIRAIVPRSVPAGMFPGAAAREHVAALKELWVAQGADDGSRRALDAGAAQWRDGGDAGPGGRRCPRQPRRAARAAAHRRQAGSGCRER